MKKLISLFILGTACFFLTSSLYAQTNKNATYSTFKTWEQTEPDMQGSSAITEIKAKLRDNDPYLWATPVKVVVIDGKGYILNGHHRIEAATEIRWDGEIPYWDIPISEISNHSGFDNAQDVVNAAKKY